MLSPSQTKEHVLNRLGWGQSSWHSQRFDELGTANYIAEQIAGTLPAIARLGTTMHEKVDRDVVEQRQLEAVLVDFWFNHFNINANGPKPDKMNNTVAGRKVGHHQNVALLPHVLGDFGSMLLETARSPSMLDYLDNRNNYREFVNNNGKVFGGNDNYARELMELHTIGVDGGYSEFDVTEVARVLTGWSINWPENNFDFKSWAHDEDEKVVMGVVYEADRGEDEGVQLLDFLANHPSAGPFLSAKLVRRFVREDLPAGVLAAASGAYLPNRSLGAVMAALFGHSDFTDPASFRSKTKPPHRYVVSALQAMGATDPSQWSELRETLFDLTIAAGQTPYSVAPPTGYPDTSGFWISGVSMLTRFDIAQAIAYHGPLVAELAARAGTDGTDPIDTVDAVAAVVVPGGLSDASRLAVLDHVAANAMTVDGRISAAAHLTMCSPEFVRY